MRAVETNQMLQLELPRYKSIEALAHADPEFISFSQGTVRVGGTPLPIKAHVQSLLASDIADYYQFVGGYLSLTC